MKRCLCFIRGHKYKKKMSPDMMLQRDFLKAYAEAEGYDDIKSYQVFSFKGSSAFRLQAFIIKTITYCIRQKRDFIYIELSRWRRNTLLTDLVRQYETKVKKDAKAKPDIIRFIKIDASQEIIDAIETHARFEKFDKHVKTVTKKPKKGSFKYCYGLWEEAKASKDTLIIWKFENNISTRRFNNFRHLCKGSNSIYDVITDHQDLSPQSIADILHKKYYLTVDGKRWTRDNVTKTMILFKDPLFDFYLREGNFQKREKADD